MTLGEFKAFVDGMDVEDAPTKEQWTRIKCKIEEIKVDGTFLPITPNELPPYIPVSDKIFTTCSARQ